MIKGPVGRKLIAPSILSADFANLEKEVKAVAEAGADWIHVDVMDGHFVPNLTIGPPVVQALKKISPLPLDVHLMIDRPERYLDQFIQAGADVLTLHVESTQRMAESLDKIRAAKVRPGITLRPGTALSEIEPFLAKVDLVLVMTVEPGFGGQKFMTDQIDKIERLHQVRKAQGLDFLIEVDGGVNEQTRAHLDLVDVLVAGHAVFKNKYDVAIRTLRGGHS